MPDELGLGPRSVLDEVWRLYSRAPIRFTLAAAVPFVFVEAAYGASELLFEELSLGRVGYHRLVAARSVPSDGLAAAG